MVQARRKKWLAPWRERQAETLPITLEMQRIYIVPSRAGFAYAASLLVLLLGAINYNLSLGYALIFLLASVGVVHILQTFTNLRGIVINAESTAPVFCGDMATVMVSLFANSPRPDIALALDPVKNSSEHVFELSPRLSQRVSVSFPATTRGWQTMPGIHLTTRYPLGLIRAWSKIRPALRQLVYPTPAAHALPLPGGTASSGDMPSRYGNSEDHDDVRPHQDSDPHSRIAWRLVARQTNDKLLTRKTSPGSGGSQTLWLTLDDASGDLESRLSQLTRWVMTLHETNQRSDSAKHLHWGLQLGQRTSIGSDSGSQHYHRCLTALACHETL